MQFKAPKDDAKYHWTQHIARKMMRYGLSADRIKRVIRAPVRAEEGVAEGTVAVMQKAGAAKRPSEIWVMYRDRTTAERPKELTTADLLSGKKIVITAWRYPGVSPIREQIPLPPGLLAELKREKLL